MDAILPSTFNQDASSPLNALDSAELATSAPLARAAHTLHELNSTLTAIQLFLVATSENPSSLQEALPSIVTAVERACLLGAQLSDTIGVVQPCATPAR
jgi:hypothetical protein